MSIGLLWTNFSEILIEILTFSFKKMRLKVSSAKWRPFCFGLDVLKLQWKCRDFAWSATSVESCSTVSPMRIIRDVVWVLTKLVQSTNSIGPLWWWNWLKYRLSIEMSLDNLGQKSKPIRSVASDSLTRYSQASVSQILTKAVQTSLADNKMFQKRKWNWRSRSIKPKIYRDPNNAKLQFCPNLEIITSIIGGLSRGQ